MASTQESPVVGDYFKASKAYESQPMLQQIPSFRDVLREENRTQSSSSIFVVVDGKEVPKPAKMRNDSFIEMVKEVGSRDSIDLMRNEDAVVIQHTGTPRGFGLFATTDLFSDHLVLSEQPALSFWLPREVCMASMRREFERQWCQLLVHEQEALKAEFPKLRPVPSGRRTLSLFQSIMLYNFALEYSYSSLDGDYANIYALASHINHACRDCANAVRGMDWYEPHRIVITLVQPVTAGEEIFIHYNTAEGRKLACAVCGSLLDRPSRRQALRNRFNEWRLKFARKDSGETSSGATSSGAAEEVDLNADVPGPRLSLLDHAKRVRNKAVRRWSHLFTRGDSVLPWQSSPWQSPPRTPYPGSPAPEDPSLNTPIIRISPPTTVGSPVRPEGKTRKTRLGGTRT